MPKANGVPFEGILISKHNVQVLAPDGSHSHYLDPNDAYFSVQIGRAYYTDDRYKTVQLIDKRVLPRDPARFDTAWSQRPSGRGGPIVWQMNTSRARVSA